MPLTKLEYTDNIQLPSGKMTDFFQKLHASMIDIIGTDLQTCKSSACILDQYCIADGIKKNGFIVLYIQILPGRNTSQKDELKEKAGQLLLDLLKSACCKIDVQARVLINEVNQQYYFMGDYNSYRTYEKLRLFVHVCVAPLASLLIDPPSQLRCSLRGAP